MKNFFIVIAITIVLLISGCIEETKNKEISMKINDVFASVDADEILISAEFNDSIDGEVNFYIIDENETFIGSAKIENKTANFLFNNSDRKIKYGKHKLKAECKTINKTKIFNLQILRYPTYITMDLNFKKIYFKDPLEISISLTSSNNSKKEIYVYADETLIGKNLTDDEGNAKFYVNLKDFLNNTEKKLNIKVIYKGDDLFENSSAEQEIFITKKIPTKIICKNVETELSNNITLSPIITTYKNETINASLKFYYGNEEINTIKFNNTYILNISKFKRGNYKLDIVFDGDEIYENSSKSIILSIVKIYENSGVKIKSFTDEGIKGLKNRKFLIYTDNTNLTKICGYEFYDIADQKGFPLYIFTSGSNEIIIDAVDVKIFTTDYENLPCHVFLCEYKGINCSISKISETLGNYENFTIVLDNKITDKKALNEYIEILKAFGFIQEYLKDKKNKTVSINQYVMENNKCAPAENLKNFSDCNFNGIFITYSNTSEIYVKDGKIFLKGDENTLYYEEIILKTIILPQWKDLLKH